MNKAKLLIVEDEAVTGMDIKNSLVEMGYSVLAVVVTGEAAVKKAGELHPDLILMDIMLAGKMSGIEAAECIKNLYHIPVVYLTAYSDDIFLEKAKVTEPFGYILKPFREQELKTSIEMALYKHAMEHTLRVNEETTRVLLNTTDDIFFLVDINSKFLAVNEALAKRAGKRVDELPGSCASDLVDKKILSPKMAGINLTIAQKKRIIFEDEFIGNWYDIKIYPVCNPDGEVVLFAVYIRDITQKKKAEEQSRQNEEFFRSLIEDTSDIIAIMNHDGSFRNESPSISCTLGYSSHLLVGKTIFDIVSEDDVVNAKSILSDIMNNPGMVKPIRLKIKNQAGTIYCMEGIISNLCNNPVIKGIVLSGWIHSRYPEKYDALIITGIGS